MLRRIITFLVFTEKESIKLFIVIIPLITRKSYIVNYFRSTSAFSFDKIVFKIYKVLYSYSLLDVFCKNSI